MLRLAKLRDIPKILSITRELCYVPSIYTKALPIVILQKQLYLAEENETITGLLGFKLSDSEVYIDCLYALTQDVDNFNRIIRSLLSEFIARLSSLKVDTITLCYDVIGNYIPSIDILYSLGFSLQSCRCIRNTDNTTIACGISKATWEDRVSIRTMLAKVCDELNWSEEDKYSLEIACVDSYTNTVVAKNNKYQIIGFATVSNTDAGVGSGFAEIAMIYVAPNYRTRGIGSALTQSAVALAGEKGARFIEATVDAENIASQDLFNSFDLATFSGKVSLTTLCSKLNTTTSQAVSF